MVYDLVPASHARPKHGSSLGPCKKCGTNCSKSEVFVKYDVGLSLNGAHKGGHGRAAQKGYRSRSAECPKYIDQHQAQRNKFA